MATTSAVVRAAAAASAGVESPLRQYKSLMLKHALLARRNVVSTCAQLFIGAAVCVMLVIFQNVANVVLGASVLHPAEAPISDIPLCTPGPSSVRVDASGNITAVGACNTLLYAPSTPAIDALMRRVAADNSVDAVPFPGAMTGPPFDLSLANASASSATQCVVGNCYIRPTIECLPCAILRDNLTLTNYMLNRPNSTQNAVWFLGAYLNTGDLSYSIFYNISTTQAPIFGNAYTTAVKRALDRAFLASAASGAVVDLDIGSRKYPTPTPRLAGYDVFSANGGQWLFVVPCILFFSILVEIVSEKEGRLRVSMRQMGMRTQAFWAAWLSYAAGMSFLATAVLEISGYACGFTFFRNASGAVTFLLFLLFSFAMLSLAILLSTLITSARTAQTVGYSFILIGFVFQFILTSAYAGLVDLLYSSTVADWVVSVRNLLRLYPAYNFSLMFYDISNQAGSVLDQSAGRIVAGPGFAWSDMYNGRVRTFAGFICNLPAPVQSINFLLLDIVVFITLALYLDAVLPGPHGSPAHPLFFLGFSNTPSSPSKASPAALDSEYADTRDAGVVEEEAAAAQEQVQDDVVVRISHMRVVYRKGVSAYAACICGGRARDTLASLWNTTVGGIMARLRGSPASGDAHYTELTSPQGAAGRARADRAVDNAGAGRGAGDVTAVEDLSLLVRRNEIVALLGHNGAGKTTTVQVLTGLFRSTSGAATVCGLDVNENTAATQRVTGVCPQYSILWPLLTPRETLRLYCAIKGIPPDQTEAEIERVLAQVRLLAVADKMVGTFSGGMARRCSLAIAALGSPKVIYLDEPTTGLDPVTRQQVWHLIQRLRENAAVVLTTHDMVEANALATRVAIMAHGRLVALGTPLRLKHAYGAGYRVNVTMMDALPGTLDRVQRGIQACAPSAALTLRDAATACFTIPFAALEAMPRVMEWADSVSALPAVGVDGAPQRLIQDFGVSGPSLESVFIAVSAAARFDLAQETAAAGEELDHDAGGHSAAAAPALKDQEVHDGDDDAPRAAPPSFGYRALCIKNGTVILRQRGLCVCQLLTPLIVLLLLVLLQKIIKVEAGEFRIQQLPSLPLPLNMNQFYPVTNSYSPQADDDDDVAASAPPLSIKDIVTAVTERQYASFAPDTVSPSRSVIADVVHAAMADQPPSCASTRSHGAALVSVVRELMGAAPCSAALVKPQLQVAAPPPTLRANGSRHYNTDCLTFFLYTASARDAGVNETALALTVGGLPRVDAPPLAPGTWPPYTPANASVNASGMLQYVRSSWCALRNGTLVNAPYFAPRWPLTSSDMDSELMSDAGILNNVSTSLLDIQAPCWNASTGAFYAAQEAATCPAYIMPDATIDFHDVAAETVSALRLAYTLQVNDLTITTYHRPSNFSRLGLLAIPRWANSLALTIDPARLSVMDSLTRAFAAQVDASTVPPPVTPGPFASSLPAIVIVSTFPMLSITNLLQFVEIVGAVLHPIVLTLQLPLFIFITVLEKEERLIELQRAMGLRYAPYIVVTYGLNLAMYSAVSLLFALAGRWLSFTFFTQTSGMLLFLAFFGWGLALCSLAMFVSTFLWSRTGATVVGYAVALFGNLVAIIVCAGIYGATPLSIGARLPNGFYIVPMFGFVRFLYLGTYNCIAKVQCYTDVRTALAPGSEIRAAVGSLYLCAFLYLVLALYLDQVLPRRYGVRKPLLFFVPTWVWRWVLRTPEVEQPSASLNSGGDAGDDVRHAYASRWSGHAQLTAGDAMVEYTRGEDADVRAARAQVADMMAVHGAPTRSQVRQFPVILHHLRKEFDVSSELMHALRRAAVALRGYVSWMGLLRKPQADEAGGVAPLLQESSMSSAAGSINGHSNGNVNGGQHHVDVHDMSLDGVQLDTEQAAMGSAGVKVAVSDVTLAIAQGVTFGVLGENGSGKSTTANMLQGLLAPTAGDAWVNGYHIVRDTDAVRLSLSIVPQHDALWADLTITEHLYFYARLKGVPANELAAAVNRAAAEVGLAAFSQRYAGDLSGGMRRRLSLALALVGNSRIVIADEPCTGLDAASRRVIWRILERARANRVIILISHDMAEVEALANEICIMTYGRLRCLGTQQALKKRYGGGFVLQINHSCPAADAATFVTERFEGARMESQFTGYMSFRVPIAAGMSRMFRIMAEEAGSAGITDWAVQQVSLDTVFKRIVRHYRGGVRTVDDAWDDE